MRRLLILSPCAVLLLASGPRAAELEDASARVELTYGYGLDNRSSMQGLIEFLPGLDFNLGERLRLVTSARLRADSDDKLEPGDPDLDSYAPGSRPVALGDAGTAELRDFYVEYRGTNSLFRIGKQQIVWGRLDGIKVLDVINPQEFREFILDDFGDSRIGLWSAYLDVARGDWRAELVAVPDGTAHAIPGEGAWFELTAPRFRFGAAPGDPALPILAAEAAHSAEQGAAGLRVSRRLGRFDVAAVAYTGRDHEPLGRIAARNGDAFIERFYERRRLFGFSAERGFGPAVLRLEYAWQPDRHFNTRSADSLDVARLDQQRGAIGFDIDGPLGVFINAQYLVDAVRDAPQTLVRPGRDEVATVFLRRGFAYDRLLLALRWYRSIREGDDIVSFTADYFVSDNIAVSLGMDRFSGAPDGLFGQFDQQDRVTLGLRFNF